MRWVLVAAVAAAAWWWWRKKKAASTDGPIKGIAAGASTGAIVATLQSKPAVPMVAIATPTPPPVGGLNTALAAEMAKTFAPRKKLLPHEKCPAGKQRIAFTVGSERWVECR